MERGHLQNLGVNGRVLLKLMCNILGVWTWIEFIYPREGFSDGHL